MGSPKPFLLCDITLLLITLDRKLLTTGDKHPIRVDRTKRESGPNGAALTRRQVLVANRSGKLSQLLVEHGSQNGSSGNVMTDKKWREDKASPRSCTRYE